MRTGTIPDRISLTTLLSLSKDLGISPDSMLITQRLNRSGWPEVIYIEKDPTISASSCQEGPAKREDPANSERVPGLGD